MSFAHGTEASSTADSAAAVSSETGKTAMLRYAFPVRVDEVVKNADTGAVEKLIVSCDYEKSVKPKGVLHWVSAEGQRAEVRMYDRLFKSEEPGALGGEEFWDDLNLESEQVFGDAVVDDGAGRCKVGEAFQFERVGYFTCDKDSLDELRVFNLTVSLKDSRGK